MVFLFKGDKFQKIKIPELTADIPAKMKADKEHPDVATNNWQEAEKWNKDGSLLLTIDNTIDGAGHTASAERTVVLGFDTSRRMTTKIDAGKRRWRISALGSVRKEKTAHRAVATAFAAVGASSEILREQADYSCSRRPVGDAPHVF